MNQKETGKLENREDNTLSILRLGIPTSVGFHFRHDSTLIKEEMKRELREEIRQLCEEIRTDLSGQMNTQIQQKMSELETTLGQNLETTLRKIIREELHDSNTIIIQGWETVEKEEND